VFHDAEYVAWANRETVHVISYSLDPEAPKPEPVVDVERDGEKVQVLQMYPMFTMAEAEAIVNEVNSAVLFPTKTPWAGVIAPDGKKILAEEPGKKGPKEFRALYEEQQKALGPTLDRPTWSKIRAALEASSSAEFDEKWAEATKAALEARSLAKDPPKPLAERVATRVESLAKIAKDRIAEAEKAKDAASVARLRAAFGGLPGL
jgi:hypothetical protein